MSGNRRRYGSVRARLAAPLIVLAMGGVTACGGSSGSMRATGDGQTGSSGTSTTTVTSAAPSTSVAGTSETAAGAAGIPADSAAAVASIQAFWAERYAGVFGAPYPPVPADRAVAMDENSNPAATCDGERLKYADTEDNAYATLCPEGPLIVWDTKLYQQETDTYGPLAAAATLAHEWGHHVQFVSGQADTLPGIISEQQADCYSGAWVRTINAAGSDLDNAVIATAAHRDNPGDDPGEDGGHGLAFDRIRAFQEGYDRGVAFCAGYKDQPPALTQLPFDTTEAATGGNLPLEESIRLDVSSLNRFFGQKVPGFTPITGALDDIADAETASFIRTVHEQVGDNGASALFAYLWAEQAQTQSGQAAGRNEDGRFLQQSCMIGGWMSTLFNGNDPDLELSPGDLDEAIFGIGRLFGTEADLDAIDAGGQFFEVVAAFRQGVVQGFDSCTSR